MGNVYDGYDAFADAIRRLATRIEDGGETKWGYERNPLWQIVEAGGELFYGTAQELSPFDTGTLHDAHRLGNVEMLLRARKSNLAWIDVFIDPDPGIINPKYGGYPGDYGPRYHRTRRAWFEEALRTVAPWFSRAISSQVKIYFRAIWP